MAAIAFGFGPMKTMPGLGQRLRKGGALGEKAIARMHRLGAALLASGHDLLDDQVALRRGRRADGYGGVGHFHMQRVAVGLGIDRNGFDAHAARGFDDPAGDLAAIGNQDSLEHCDISRMSRKKLAPDLIRGGYRFSDKDMRKVNTREPVALPLRRQHKNVNRRSPIEARGEGVRHPGSHPGHAGWILRWSMIFSENRFPLFGIML